MTIPTLWRTASLKGILIATLLLVMIPSLSAGDEGDIRVAKIRIYLAEAEFAWTQDGIERLDGNDVPAALKEETVISFLSVHPGLVAPEGEITRRCLESERRLRESGYFYEAAILVVPPKAKANERTIVITLSPGFFTRFGGGNAWGMFGKVGICGERQSLYAYAGYNRNGISYLHSRVGGSQLGLGGKLFWYGPGEYPGSLDGYDAENRFLGALTALWSLTPDACIGVEPTVEGFGLSSGGVFSLQPFITLRKYVSRGHDSESGLELRGFWYPSTESVKGEIGGYLRAGFTARTTVAFKGSAGYSPTDLPGEALFDLRFTEDRNVRSGYSRGELAASDFVLGSAEARWDFLETRIPPIVNLTAQAFVFADAASVGVDGLSPGSAFRDAYGLGLRVLFDNPVFAYFTLSYGINHEGSGRFIFCGTAGY